MRQVSTARPKRLTISLCCISEAYDKMAVFRNLEPEYWELLRPLQYLFLETHIAGLNEKIRKASM